MVVPWVQPFPNGWQASGNSGATWVGPPAPTSLAQVAGPTGTQRYRAQFTIPTNVAGTYLCTVSGDIYDGSVNVNAHLYYDGVDQGPVTPLAGPRTFTLPVSPGAHTIELWIGQADDNGGLTVPAVSFDFADSVDTAAVPCDCCPVGMEPAPSLSQVRFATVAETAAQAGWTPTQLAATIDGVTTSPLVSGYNSPSGGAASTTVNVTYTTGAPWNRVRGLRLWNQTGTDLNDSDGLGTVTADFYAGASLVGTYNFAGVNGGSAQDLVLPALSELNGVDRVILRSLGKLSGSTVAPTWRELQLLVIRDAYPCRRSSGVVEWYDEGGNRATPVAASSVFIPSSFTLNGSFFGDGPDSSGENLCNVYPAPASTTNLAPPVSGCYDPTVVGGNVSMTWTGASTVEFEYGNPPRTSGGVTISFTSPDLGTVSWPNAGTLVPGQQITSSPGTAGRTVRLTYLSGPTGANAVQSPGGPTLRFHFGTTDNTTPALRVRLDILT